jgi:hypothetical protein
VVDLQGAVLVDDARSTRMPRDEWMLIDWSITTIDRGANGSVRGIVRQA